MKYIVIEKWENLPAPYVISNEDGDVIIFDNKDLAQEEADNCQDGTVVEY